MEDIIRLYSRDGSTCNYLKKLKRVDEKESKTYVLKNTDPSLRMGYFGRRKYLEIPSGTIIAEGSMLLEADEYVKSIDFVYSTGFTITFE